MSKAKNQPTNTTERRFYTGEFRATQEGRTVEGYAAVFSSPTDMGWYNEVIEPGAFDAADLNDVRALFNHDPDHLLARTSSKTLEVNVDEKGLFYSFEMPNTTLGNDVLEMIRRGDLSQSSFAFRVAEQNWLEREGRPDLRQITKIDMVADVSPVTYPAYADTSVAARSRKDQNEEPPTTEESTTDFKVAVDFINQQRARCV